MPLLLPPAIQLLPETTLFNAKYICLFLQAAAGQKECIDFTIICECFINSLFLCQKTLFLEKEKCSEFNFGEEK